jgi:mannose-6-phosphate isomerase-like protein (cupin superfamily)
MRTEKPWGFFEVLYEGDGFKVKSVVVNPGARLSLQTHKNRSEHWTVVRGVSVFQIGEKKEEVHIDQSRYIAKGEKHRLENKGTKPLEIIEVQCGEYLGEDDIVRIEDDYDRS